MHSTVLSTEAAVQPVSRIRPVHRVAGSFFFLIYLAALAYFLFFAEMLGRTGYETETVRMNTVLLKEIHRYWTYREQIGMQMFLLNTVGNVLAFMPLGFFLPVIRGTRRGFFLVLLAGFMFSVCVECCQLLFAVGSFDVDDMLLNTIGTAVGYFVFRLWYRGLAVPSGHKGSHV